jgi:hypothetical protein
VVAASGPRRAGGGLDERVELRLGEVGDQRAFVALGPNLEDPVDRGGVLGVTHHAVAVEGADRGQPGVARPRATSAVGFEVIEKRADQRRVELAEVEA